MHHGDDTGRHCRIGVLTPHFDIVPELEFAAMAPVGTSVHAARVPFGVSAGATVIGADAVRAFAEPPEVDQAAELLAAAPIDVIVYAFTSSSYLCGIEADTALVKRLQGRTQGVPVVVPCIAALEALRELGVQRLALVNPPWFPSDADRLGAEYFASQGFEVVYHARAGLEHSELPAGQLDIEPGPLHDWVSDNVPADVDAIFIGGNGFRAVGAIEVLEKDLERPVLSANQVAFWQALRETGNGGAVAGYGRLLADG